MKLSICVCREANGGTERSAPGNDSVETYGHGGENRLIPHVLVAAAGRLYSSKHFQIQKSVHLMESPEKQM